MAGLNRYTQRQLKSSLVGVPQVDQTGQVIADIVLGGAQQITNLYLSDLIKKQQAEDSLAMNAAKQTRDNARLEMEQFTIDNPDPTTWADGMRATIDRQEVAFGQQKFSFNERREQSLKQKAFKADLALSVGIAANKKTINDDVAVNKANLFSTISDPRKSELEVEDQKDMAIKSLTRKHGSAVAQILLDEIVKEAEKEKSNVVFKEAQNFTAGSPELALDILGNKEKTASVRELSLLSNTQKQSLKTYANTIVGKKKSDSELAADNMINEAYGAIRNGAVDLDRLTDAIDANADILDEDANTAAEKIKTYFTTYNAATKDPNIVTNDATTIAMIKINKQVRRGDITMNKGFDLYKQLKDKPGISISDTDNKSFLNGLQTAEEYATSTKAKRNIDSVDSVENKLRDAIENQPNFMGSTEIDEVLRDFANIAVIEFNRSFGTQKPEDYDINAVNDVADDLLRRYTMTTDQQSSAVEAKAVEQAKNLKQQQEAVLKLARSLRAAGKTSQMTSVLEEAVSRGILEDIDGDLQLTGDASEDMDAKSIDLRRMLQE